ncbi:hypothetical protein GCM10023147_41720 [Tsukamurella soli]|uniref:Uncharacterized protein n=1 Tax=Tsukamurella soli TaxID=644556 RepID=A0ABP8K926_9ACTN
MRARGGGLAAQPTHRIAERNIPPAALRLLVYPMLDPYASYSSRDDRRARIWDSRSNSFA